MTLAQPLPPAPAAKAAAHEAMSRSALGALARGHFGFFDAHTQAALRVLEADGHISLPKAQCGLRIAKPRLRAQGGMAGRSLRGAPSAAYHRYPPGKGWRDDCNSIARKLAPARFGIRLPVPEPARQRAGESAAESTNARRRQDPVRRLVGQHLVLPA